MSSLSWEETRRPSSKKKITSDMHSPSQASTNRDWRLQTRLGRILWTAPCSSLRQTHLSVLLAGHDAPALLVCKAWIADPSVRSATQSHSHRPGVCLELRSCASLAARRTMRSSRVPIGNQQATSALLAASISLLISSRPRFSAHSLSSCKATQQLCHLSLYCTLNPGLPADSSALKSKLYELQ